MQPRQTLTMSSVGQITIPRSIRKILGFEKGDKLELEVDEQKKTITITKQPTFDEVMEEMDRINAKYPKIKVNPKYEGMSIGEMAEEQIKNMKEEAWD